MRSTAALSVQRTVGNSARGTQVRASRVDWCSRSHDGRGRTTGFPRRASTRTRSGRFSRLRLMPLNPDTAEQERLAVAANRRRTGVMRREGMVEILFGAGFFAAVVVLWQVVGAPASEIDVVPALACMVCLAVAVHVPFAVGDGYTVPTQLAFVPLLFTLPPAFVPPAVVLALIAARVPAVAAGRWPASRLLLVPGDAWFALGPAVVLAAAGTHSVGHLNVLVLVAALLAQALAEIAAWAVRERLLGGAGLREQLGELWIHGVDLALTPLALVVALVVEQRAVGRPCVPAAARCACHLLPRASRATGQSHRTQRRPIAAPPWSWATSLAPTTAIPVSIRTASSRWRWRSGARSASTRPASQPRVRRALA